MVSAIKYTAFSWFYFFSTVYVFSLYSMSLLPYMLAEFQVTKSAKPDGVPFNSITPLRNLVVYIWQH